MTRHCKNDDDRNNDKAHDDCHETSLRPQHTTCKYDKDSKNNSTNHDYHRYENPCSCQQNIHIRENMGEF